MIRGVGVVYACSEAIWVASPMWMKIMVIIWGILKTPGVLKDINLFIIPIGGGDGVGIPKPKSGIRPSVNRQLAPNLEITISEPPGIGHLFIVMVYLAREKEQTVPVWIIIVHP